MKGQLDTGMENEKFSAKSFNYWRYKLLNLIIIEWVWFEDNFRDWLLIIWKSKNFIGVNHNNGNKDTNFYINFLTKKLIFHNKITIKLKENVLRFWSTPNINVLVLKILVSKDMGKKVFDTLEHWSGQLALNNIFINFNLVLH